MAVEGELPESGGGVIARDARRTLGLIRSLSIFRPYSQKMPVDLLAMAGIDADDPDVDADWMRVAKLDDMAIGVYLLSPVGSDVFHLTGLAVATEHRGRGLGRWLVGHAIGLAETKGGRCLQVPNARRVRLFARMGFAASGNGYQYVMIPE